MDIWSNMSHSLLGNTDRFALFVKLVTPPQVKFVLQIVCNPFSGLQKHRDILCCGVFCVFKPFNKAQEI